MRDLPGYTHTKSAVLVTVSKVIQKYKGNWCLATQNTIILLLEEHHKINIKRRSLNYHLADLREHGLIRTIRRNGRNADGTLYLLSSATCLTIKGCYYLARNGYNWAYKKAKQLQKTYYPSVPAKNIQQSQSTDDREEKTLSNYNPFKDPAFREATGLDTIIFDTS